MDEMASSDGGVKEATENQRRTIPVSCTSEAERRSRAMILGSSGTVCQPSFFVNVLQSCCDPQWPHGQIAYASDRVTGRSAVETRETSRSKY